MRKPIVKSVSILETIEILGHKIQGYEAIHNAVEVCSSLGSSTVNENWEDVVVYEPYIKTRNPKILIPGLHVLEVSDCFMYFDEYYWDTHSSFLKGRLQKRKSLVSPA